MVPDVYQTIHFSLFYIVGQALTVTQCKVYLLTSKVKQLSHRSLSLITQDRNSFTSPMLLDPDVLNGLLTALGLSASLEKPIDALISPVSSVVDGLVNTADGLLTGLGLPALTSLPIIGGILEVDPSTSTSASMPHYTAVGSAVTSTLQSLANDSCTVQPYTAPNISLSFPAYDEALANIYRYRQQQSVNLGSWYGFILKVVAIY